MSYKTSIQFRACVLLLVFSLNIMLGFTCAIGVDMKFNNTHPGKVETPPPAGHSHSHSHEHGKGAAHHDGAGKASHHDSHHGNASDPNTASDEHDCCSEDVVKLLQSAKKTVKSITLDHPELTAISSLPFYTLEAPSLHNPVKRHTRHFVRNYHPPIPDIRIAIRSFQI